MNKRTIAIILAIVILIIILLIILVTCNRNNDDEPVLQEQPSEEIRNDDVLEQEEPENQVAEPTNQYPTIDIIGTWRSGSPIRGSGSGRTTLQDEPFDPPGEIVSENDFFHWGISATEALFTENTFVIHRYYEIFRNFDRVHIQLSEEQIEYEYSYAHQWVEQGSLEFIVEGAQARVYRQVFEGTYTWIEPEERDRGTGFPRIQMTFSNGETLEADIRPDEGARFNLTGLGVLPLARVNEKISVENIRGFSPEGQH